MPSPSLERVPAQKPTEYLPLEPAMALIQEERKKQPRPSCELTASLWSLTVPLDEPWKMTPVTVGPWLLDAYLMERLQQAKRTASPEQLKKLRRALNIIWSRTHDINPYQTSQVVKKTWKKEEELKAALLLPSHTEPEAQEDKKEREEEQQKLKKEGEAMQKAIELLTHAGTPEAIQSARGMWEQRVWEAWQEADKECRLAQMDPSRFEKAIQAIVLEEEAKKKQSTTKTQKKNRAQTALFQLYAYRAARDLFYQRYP